MICYRHLFTFDGNNYCVEKLLLIELRQKKKERGDKKLVKLNGDYWEKDVKKKHKKIDVSNLIICGNEERKKKKKKQGG